MRSDAPRQRVLVVDDERVIAVTLALILNQAGFEAAAAYNGESTVGSATAFMPNVLIMDVFMDGMNGSSLNTSWRCSAALSQTVVLAIGFSGSQNVSSRSSPR